MPPLHPKVSKFKKTPPHMVLEDLDASPILRTQTNRLQMFADLASQNRQNNALTKKSGSFKKESFISSQ